MVERVCLFHSPVERNRDVKINVVHRS
jgi:hypothetical protein